MLRLFVPLFTLVIALTAAAWFWAGKPSAQHTINTLAGLPKPLQMLNKTQTLDLAYQPGIAEHWIDNSRIITLGGKFEREYNIYVCEQRKYLRSPKPLYVGLDFLQIKRLHQDKSKFNTVMYEYLHDPILDKQDSEQDLPGVVITSDGELSIAAEEEITLLTDTQFDEFEQWAFASNDKFTLVIRKQADTECDYGILNIAVYRHVSNATNMLFWLNHFDDQQANSDWSFGQVKAGYYPIQKNTRYGIQSLAEHMQSCRLMVLEHDRWQFASRYYYTDKIVKNKFDAKQSGHCRKVLATFYHTPAGEVLRNRALAAEQENKPVIALALAENTNVKASFNNQPVKVAQGSLSHFQNLYYTSAGHDSYSWHKVRSEEVHFSFLSSSKPFYLYVLGRNVTITGATVVEVSDQCIKGLCEQAGDVTLYHIKPSAKEVFIEAQGILPAKSPLLKQATTRLAAKPDVTVITNQSAPETNQTFTVFDRKGKILEVSDIPHLLAPYSGRINPAMGDKITLTIDKYMQQVVTERLAQYLASIDEKLTFATISIASENGELLALAQSPQLSNDTHFARAGYIQSTLPVKSPLTFWAGYHDDSNSFVSGSVFKLLSALLITEKLGHEHPMVQGLSYKEWERIQDVTQMNPEFGCFPVIDQACVVNGLSNFVFEGEKQTIFNRMKKAKHTDSVYGLKHAVRDSLNTYFAFMVDKVASEPFYWQSAFGPDGYELTSPLRHFVSQFGFYSPLRLDAGLLEEKADNSVLSVPASKLQHYTAQSQFWRAAVGEQNKVTALQVAQFTLAIAKGELIPLSLLKSVDGKQANVEAVPLNIKAQSFKFIRESMLLAGKNYTALKDIPYDIYAKSGTGEVGEKNNAWMTAFVNKENPVVITCQISQVTGTGGELCGNLIKFLLQDQSEIPALIALSSELHY